MKIIIIGAGPAGLTAAYKLLQSGKGYDVAVIESTDAIGGISKTVPYKGNRMDIGGHRFFSKDPEIMRFFLDRMALQGAPSFDDYLLDRKKTLSEDGPDPSQQDRVMLFRDRVSRIYYNDRFFDYPLKVNFKTIKNLGFTTALKAGFSYFKSVVKKRPETSLEDFYINRFGKVLYEIFFEGYTEKLWGIHPSKISADWGAQRVKGISVFALISDFIKKTFKITDKNGETSLIDSFLYPKLGPGQFYEEMAKDIEYMGGKIVKNCEIVSLHKTENRIDYIVASLGENKMKIEGDVFISSMALKDLTQGIIGDAPDNYIKSIASGLPYREFVTVGVLVERLKIKNNTKIKTLGNIVPDCWIYVQDKSVKLGRIQIFNNWSPYMVKDPENTVFLGLEYFCSEGDEFWTKSDSDLSVYAINELVKMGIIEDNVVLDYHIERMKKAYPAYFGTYQYIDELRDYLNKIDNLYCIGRNGQHRYNNMDHSILTAMKTAEIIINGNGNKDEIWKVNTEKDYHEEIKETGKQ